MEQLKQQGLEFVTWFKDPVTHSAREELFEPGEVVDMGFEPRDSINLTSFAEEDKGRTFANK